MRLNLLSEAEAGKDIMFKLTNPQKLPDPIKVLESLSAELKQIVSTYEENQDANPMYKGIKDILKRGEVKGI